MAISLIPSPPLPPPVPLLPPALLPALAAVAAAREHHRLIPMGCGVWSKRLVNITKNLSQMILETDHIQMFRTCSTQILVGCVCLKMRCSQKSRKMFDFENHLHFQDPQFSEKPYPPQFQEASFLDASLSVKTPFCVYSRTWGTHFHHFIWNLGGKKVPSLKRT